LSATTERGAQFDLELVVAAKVGVFSSNIEYGRASVLLSFLAVPSETSISA
jgi:hypothetical protein